MKMGIEKMRPKEKKFREWEKKNNIRSKRQHKVDRGAFKKGMLDEIDIYMENKNGTKKK